MKNCLIELINAPDMIINMLNDNPFFYFYVNAYTRRVTQPKGELYSILVLSCMFICHFQNYFMFGLFSVFVEKNLLQIFLLLFEVLIGFSFVSDGSCCVIFHLFVVDDELFSMFF